MKRIGKVLNINRDNEKMMEDYEKLASDVCTVTYSLLHVDVLFCTIHRALACTLVGCGTGLITSSD